MLLQQALEREPALGQVFAQLLPGVVQGLVEGAAGRVQPFGENVDRDAVHGERHEHPALVRRQLGDRALQRRDELGLLGRGLGPEAGVEN